MKKEDISKGLSKIKKSSKTLIEEVYWKETRFAGVAGRRKISLSQLLSTDQPELRGATTTTNSNNVSTFYVSGPTNSPSLVSSEGGSSEAGCRRSSRRESSQGSLSPSADPAALPVAPTRRRSGIFMMTIAVSPHLSLFVPFLAYISTSGKTGRSVVRPLNPPPAPPLPTSPPPSESDHHLEAEGIYTSSLFKSEPLYQFYQEREALQEHIYLQSEPKEPGGLLEEIEADPLYQASRLQDSIYETSRLQLSKPPASRPQELMCQTSPPDSSRNPWGTGPVQGLLNSPDQRTLWAELPQVSET